jgi:HSP90 family molecular chaperone
MVDSKDSTRHEIAVDVPNIIQLLGASLYADREVVVREILQNAIDALIRRSAEDPEFGIESAQIIIEIIPSENRISFTDNGI